jgi:hypothetical protein
VSGGTTNESELSRTLEVRSGFASNTPVIQGKLEFMEDVIDFVGESFLGWIPSSSSNWLCSSREWPATDRRLGVGGSNFLG